jgi:predicted amino acid dehydrogenase
VPLHRGTINNRLVSSQFTIYDTSGAIRTALFEESPQSFTGISEVQITNPGTGFTSSPTITINGDGTGATAEAVIVNGRIESINITNRGSEYTRATVTITGGNGYGAEAIAVIDGKTGVLRTIYYDTLAQRQIINAKAGTIDYDKGIVTINNIRFLSVDSDDSLIRMSIESQEGIVASNRNTILTIDETDPISIVTTLTTANY